MDRRLPSYRQARTTPYARPEGEQETTHGAARSHTNDRVTPAGAPAASSHAPSYAPLLPMSAATAVAQRAGKVKQESASGKRRDEDDSDEEHEIPFGSPPETDPRRLEQRQKQIDRGKATEEYKLYLSRVPIETRVHAFRYEIHPVTPNKTQGCSKRSWDGQVRKWRRLLHAFADSDKKGGAAPAGDNATMAAAAAAHSQPPAPDAPMHEPSQPSLPLPPLPLPSFAPSAPLHRKPPPVPAPHSLLHPTPLRGRSWADETEEELAATEAAAAAPTWMPPSLAAAASARPAPSATLSLPLSALSPAPPPASFHAAASPIAASPFASNSAAAVAPDQLGALFDEEALLAPVASGDSIAQVKEEDLVNYDDDDDEMRAQVLAEAMRQCER